MELVLREAFRSTDETHEALQKIKDLMQKGAMARTTTKPDSEPGKTKAQQGNGNNKTGPKQHKCQKKGHIASKCGKPSSPHNSLHWTACYDDNCLVHKDGKDNSYYPRIPKKELDRQPSKPDWDWEKHDIEENCKELRTKVNEIANDIDQQLHKTTEVLEELDKRMGNQLTPPRSATQGIDDIPVQAQGSVPVIARSLTPYEQQEARMIARIYQNIHKGQQTNQDIFYIHGRAAWEIKTYQAYLATTIAQSDESKETSS
ncbi:hypothetical protein S40285_10837 [Stachybotrys chlorohalonatus IBT 40285]|uniref:CCHC-type domain-containing protein n=1 Tax=Stachybotrys chlorohalonatus (strain IBT 40285) TaxID=1283841 RepID=A0A084R0P3_STAC4|nr:hypothetical protein S40285_10837 [Stachybotrys chlorohalonata IBT 40285]